ncbi:MAG: hypothetical protein QG630_255 [Patescibacteria group bacterium]|nr:hypothetical protein [Patescibacteria group bacterium]
MSNNTETKKRLSNIHEEKSELLLEEIARENEDKNFQESMRLGNEFIKLMKERLKEIENN